MLAIPNGVPHQFTDVSEPVPLLRREGGGLSGGPRPLTPARPPLPGPPELLPGRPDAIVDLQTDDGRRARRAAVALRRRARRGDRLRRARLARRPARARATCRTALRRRAARRGGGLRRLGLARARAGRDAAAARQRPRVLQLVPHRGDDPGARRRVRSDGRDGRVRGRRRRLRRGLGRRRAAARARRHRRAVVGGFNAPNRVVLTRDARPGSDVPDRGLRDQRPDLRVAAQLHLDAHGDARRLRARARRGRRAGRRSRSSRPTAGSTAVVPGRRAPRAGRRRLRVHRGAGVDADGALLFSSPNTNAIYRWTPRTARSPSSAPRAATPAPTSAATTSPARTG